MESGDQDILAADNEQFSTDDNITRREIYMPANATHNGIVSVLAFNFTNAFTEGATQWCHLKEPYLSFFLKIFNVLSYLIGNKQINLVVPHHASHQAKRRAAEKNVPTLTGAGEPQPPAPVAPTTGKRGSATAANLLRIQPVLDSKPPWYGVLKRGEDQLFVDIETLFEENESTKVAGFRLWIFSRLTLPSTEATSTPMPVPADFISRALDHSFSECRELQRLYQESKASFLKNRAKKATVPLPDTSLEQVYHFTSRRSYKELFTELILPTLEVTRPALSVGFEDSRPFRTVTSHEHQTMNKEGGAYYKNPARPCRLQRIFTKEAAMFYGVRSEGINRMQCDINSYVRHSPDAAPPERAGNEESHNVATYLQLPDAALHHYVYKEGVYRVQNQHATPEFMIRMPLPHRIGSSLPYLTKAKPNPNIPENATAAEIEAIKKKEKEKEEEKRKKKVVVDGEEEEEEEEENEEMVVDSSNGINQNNNAFPDSIPTMDEDWLEENDPDGVIRAQILLKPRNFSLPSLDRPMGLHYTHFEVRTEDILASKNERAFHFNHHLSAKNITEEVRRSYLEHRTQHIRKLLAATALPTLPCERRVLLHCQRERGVSLDPAHVTISATPDARAPSTSDPYAPSTRAFVQKKPGKDGMAEVAKTVLGEMEGEEEEMVAGDMEEDMVVEPPSPLSTDEQNRIGLIQEHLAKAVRPPVGATRKRKSNPKLDVDIPFQIPQNREVSAEWLSHVAHANTMIADDIRGKYASIDNSLEGVEREVADLIGEDAWKLKRDVWQRERLLNTKRHRALDHEYYDPKERVIPPDKSQAFKNDKNKLIAANLIAGWHTFFTAEDVSAATQGIRSDLVRVTTDITNGRKKIQLSHVAKASSIDARPYHQFKIWLYALFCVIIQLHYNFKNMAINYFSKFHHCRYYYDHNNPKLNCLNHGDHSGGKSFMLIMGVKKTCPSRVCSMLTKMTDNAFNIDRNLDDMLIVVEEMEDKYLGIGNGSSSKGRSGGAAASGGEALNYYKGRLTSGQAITLAMCQDEEGMKAGRDSKENYCSCQGNYLVATNARLADADRHLLSRFMLVSVPKAMGSADSVAKREALEFGTNRHTDEIIFQQHKDIHSVYFMVEMFIKSNVLGNDVYGVTVDGAKIMIGRILDAYSRIYNISTSNQRKRNDVLEMARCMCISYAVWNMLTSPLLQYLQYDPVHGDYIGFNPRCILEGVFPFLVITKDMVFDSLLTNSGIWQHDNLNTILEIVVRRSRLLSPDGAIYRQVLEQDTNSTTQIGVTFSKNNKVKSARVPKSTGAHAAPLAPMPNAAPPPQGTPSLMPGRSFFQPQTRPDYNYVSLLAERNSDIYKTIAGDLGDLQISSNDVGKIMDDIREDNADIPIASYRLLGGSGIGRSNDYGSLVLDTEDRRICRRKCIIMDHCPKTRQARISILVAYLKEKLPRFLPDSLIANLKQNLPEASPENETQVVGLETMAGLQDANAEKKDGQSAVEEEGGEKQRGGQQKKDGEEMITVGDDEEEMGAPKKSRTEGGKRRRRASSRDKSESEGDSDEEDTKQLLAAARNVDIRKEAEAIVNRVKRSVYYGKTLEIPMIMAIRKAMENGILEKYLSEQMTKEIAQEYITSFSGELPWFNFVGADHPASLKISEAFPAFAGRLKRIKDFGKDITFNEIQKTLTLQPQATGPIVLRNDAYVPPSALASLSVYDATVASNGVQKNTNTLYNSMTAWTLTEDIDFTFSKVHLSSIGFIPPDADDLRFRCMNYPLFHYQTSTDYARSKEERVKRSAGQTVAIVEPSASSSLTTAKRTAEDDAFLNQFIREYPLNDVIEKIYRMGMNIKQTLYNFSDAETNTLQDTLFGNCTQLQKEYACQKESALMFRKMEDGQRMAQKEAKEKAWNILEKRLTVPLTLRQVNTTELLNRLTAQQQAREKAKASHKSRAVMEQTQSASSKRKLVEMQTNVITGTRKTIAELSRK